MNIYETYNGYTLPIYKPAQEEVEENFEDYIKIIESIDMESYKELDEYFED